MIYKIDCIFVVLDFKGFNVTDVMGNGLYKKSKWIHKYFGLVLLIFLSYMSISGVLLNHPIALRNLSVSSYLVPEYYHPDNWNRSTLKSALFIGENKDSVLVFGKQGVYLSVNDTKSFAPAMDGEYPKAPWKRRTNHVVMDTVNKRFLAVSNGGLFECGVRDLEWKNIKIEGERDPIEKILQLPEKTVLFTKSCLYIAKNSDRYSFEKVIPKRDKDVETVSLIHLFFKLHDGSIWGMPGKIVWDIAGLILFFLCVSAFYIWYYPKKWKARYKKKSKLVSGSEKKARLFFYKYHKKLGWYFAIPLLIITFTGMFMRPPLIVALAKGKIDMKFYPAPANSNPWYGKIRNALYDSQNNRIVMDCKDGVWIADVEKEMVFSKKKLPLRIFAMGATVFEEKEMGKWLIGSFGGLQEYDVKTNTARVIVGRKKGSTARPAKTMVTGYFECPDGKEYVLGHRKGLCDITAKPIRDEFVMPQCIKENYRMPLWNYLFELHNARIFRSLLGGIYILIIPLFGLLGLLLLISGIFDYWFVRLKNRKR